MQAPPGAGVPNRPRTLVLCNALYAMATPGVHTCGLDPGANVSVGAVLGAGAATGIEVAAEGEEEEGE